MESSTIGLSVLTINHGVIVTLGANPDASGSIRQFTASFADSSMAHLCQNILTARRTALAGR